MRLEIAQNACAQGPLETLHPVPAVLRFHRSSPATTLMSAFRDSAARKKAKNQSPKSYV